MKPDLRRAPDRRHDPKVAPYLDVDVDRILNAIASTRPAPGLEHRVLRRLEQREPATSRFTWPPAHLFQRAQLRAWCMALSAAAAAITIFAVLLHRPGAPATRPDRHLTATAGVSVAPASRSQSAMLSAADRRLNRAVAGPRITPSRGLATLSHAGQHPHVLLCDCDPTAVAEANAPSRPAPPLPLTEQEKLLLRIAHHPNAVEVAALDPREREASIIREQAAYRRFFNPPAPQVPLEPSPQVGLSPQPDQQVQAPPATQQQPSTAVPNGDQP